MSEDQKPYTETLHALRALQETLTTEQVAFIAKRLKSMAIKGHGDVTIRYVEGRARFIISSVSEELP
jgi:hypothetical protein